MPSTGSEVTFTKLLAKRIKALIAFWKSPLGIALTSLGMLCFGLIFWFSPLALNHLQEKFGQRFVFFSLSEPFLALLKFSFLCLMLLLFPLLWLGLVSLFEVVLKLDRKRFYLFYFSGLFFFYTGVLFAYFVILPYGIKFLLAFQTEEVKPAISLEHFANFFNFFIILFGFLFEMPLLMIFLSLAKVLNPRKIKPYRKEIFFSIVILSAVITPTPDAINMGLLAIPVYLLFELGLFLSGRFR